MGEEKAVADAINDLKAHSVRDCHRREAGSAQHGADRDVDAARARVGITHILRAIGARGRRCGRRRRTGRARRTGGGRLDSGRGRTRARTDPRVRRLGLRLRLGRGLGLAVRGGRTRRRASTRLGGGRRSVAATVQAAMPGRIVFSRAVTRLNTRRNPGDSPVRARPLGHRRRSPVAHHARVILESSLRRMPDQSAIRIEGRVFQKKNALTVM